MKKAMAYNFILLAGIIILVHDIVPHHHHDDELRNPTELVTTHTDQDHHHFPRHQHQYEDDLFVIRFVNVFLNQPGGSFNKFKIIKFNFRYSVVYLNTDYTRSIYVPPEILSFFPDTHLFLPEHLSQPNCLRAPPFA